MTEEELRSLYAELQEKVKAVTKATADMAQEAHGFFDKKRLDDVLSASREHQDMMGKYIKAAKEFIEKNKK